MNSSQAIREVSKRLASATSLVAIFGTLPKGTAIEQKAYLRKQFSYLVNIVHPDHADPSAADDAAKAFTELNSLRQTAEAAILCGTYDKPIAHHEPHDDADRFEITSTVGTFRLRNAPHREGDFSILYRGVLAGAKPIPVLAKVACEPSFNAWLEKEAVVLKQVARLPRLAKVLPQLIDTVMIPGERNTRYRANIFRFDPDFVSVADIIAAYPKGLEAPQAAWVARRIFAQSLVGPMLGYVHGAITPDHVLVNPITHDPLHIGWTHAVKSGPITHVIDRWKDLYPPEVLGKKDADHRTDLYMAGASIVRLMGGNVTRKSLPAAVPDRVAKIILRTLEHSPAHRPDDGLRILSEFTDAVRKEWGRVYRPLQMPIHA